MNAALCHAFSFGEIRLHSKFGDPFLAEVELFHEVGGVIEIEIGSREDYQRLQVERPELLDKLNIVEIRRLDSNSVLAHITSESPLSYPSFNLILKAIHNRGTIYESYLITVDFQNSLSLGGSSPQTGIKKAENKQGTEKDLPGTHADSAQENASAGVADIQELKGDSAEDAPSLSADVETAYNLIPKAPAPLKSRIFFDSPASFVELEAPKSFEAYIAGPNDKPSFLVSNDIRIDYQGDIFPKIPPGQIPDSVSKENKKPVQGKKQLSEQLNKDLAEDKLLLVRSGDSLSSIAQKISKNQGVKRVAVALWMNNRDSFIYGNMNGLKAKSSLRIDGLSERLEGLSGKKASKIYANQLREWEFLKKSLKAVPALELEKPPIMMLNALSLTKVFSLMRDWRSTWERSEWSRHWELFSNNASEKTKIYKKTVFQRFQQVGISAENVYITMLSSGPGVFFDQKFSSSALESIGKKEIHLAAEGEEWKIQNELFYLEKSVRKKNNNEKSPDFSKFQKGKPSLPYVLHLSSHKHWKSAMNELKSLSDSGFPAYISPYYPGKGPRIFRILLGRFGTLKSAAQESASLRKKGIQAIPWNLPYALQMGSYSSEEDAKNKLAELWEKGVPGFLIARSPKGFRDMDFEIFSGAFEDRHSAIQMGKAMDGFRMDYEIREP